MNPFLPQCEHTQLVKHVSRADEGNTLVDFLSSGSISNAGFAGSGAGDSVSLGLESISLCVRGTEGMGL